MKTGTIPTIDPERSRIMRAVKAANTRPEMVVRRILWRAGFRYRLHDEKLPGKPDIVFPSRRIALFVHGCFWHGHECKSAPNRDPSEIFSNPLNLFSYFVRGGVPIGC